MCVYEYVYLYTIYLDVTRMHVYIQTFTHTFAHLHTRAHTWLALTHTHTGAEERGIQGGGARAHSDAPRR
jgi:hypothetical protein